MLRIVALALVLVACSAKAPEPAAPQAEPLIDPDYPALRFVPSRASAALIARRTSQLVSLARELGELAAIATGRRVEDVDGWFRHRLGVSPIDARELGESGIDLGASAALFVHGDGLTAVAPVASRARLADVLARHAPAGETVRERVGDVELSRWDLGELSVSWVLMPRWLLVHVAAAGSGSAWIEEVIAVNGRGLGQSRRFAAARERAAAHARRSGERYRWEPAEGAPDLVGVLDPGLLAAELGMTGDPCIDAPVAAIPSVTFGARVGGDHIAGFFELELADGAAALLAERPAPPRAGFLEQIDRAPVALLWTVPPATLERIRARWGCAALEGEVTGLAGGQLPGARSLGAAVFSVDPDGPSGRGVAWAGGLDPRILGDVLDEIPGRRLLEKRRQVDGISVTVFGGRLGIPEIAYHRSRAQTVIGAPASVVMASLAGGAGDPPLFRLRLAPSQVPNLPALARHAALAMGARGAGLWAATAQRLFRYRWGELGISARGNRVRLEAAMMLAAEDRR